MSDNTDTPQTNSFYIVIGVLASIFAWVAIWQLAILLLDKKSRKVQLQVYTSAFIISLILLFWLGWKHPRSLSPGS